MQDSSRIRQLSTQFYIRIPTNWKKIPISTLLRAVGDSKKRELADEEDELHSMMDVTVPEPLQYSLRCVVWPGSQRLDSVNLNQPFY
jgi:hypothetical protein